jgi:hypothetical protein
VNVNAERRSEGTMSLISGTKKWRATIEGESPPGMNDVELQAAVLSNLTVGANLLPFCRNIRVDVSDDFVPSQPGGVKLMS